MDTITTKYLQDVPVYATFTYTTPIAGTQILKKLPYDTKEHAYPCSSKKRGEYLLLRGSKLVNYVVGSEKENAPKDISELSYYEFSQLINDGKAELIVDGGDFKIYRVKERYFEKEKNPKTDRLCELNIIAKLEYSVLHDVRADGEELEGLFDSYCCGEHVADNRIEYLWFNKK